MADLSPEAQAVAWAYDNAPEKPTDNHRYYWLAAALRAVADQLGYCIIYDDDDKDYMVDVADLLAIAAELESDNG